MLISAHREMQTPARDLIDLVGQLVIGADPFKHFRGTGALAELFAKAGWTITSDCPGLGWEKWVSGQLRQFLKSESAAVEKMLVAMAQPDEFLDSENRVKQKERAEQVDRWNGFLAPHGLQIVDDKMGPRVLCITPQHLPARDREATLAKKATEERKPNYLRISRAEAEALIARQVDTCRKFVVEAQNNPLALEQELTTWVEYTKELLKRRIFTTDEEADKFDATVRFSYAMNPSPMMRWGELLEDLTEYIRRLQSLQRRLDLFEQAPSETTPMKIAASARPHGKKVFIVHGHDGAAKQEVARFVEKLKLQAIILDEQANKGRTIIEKFEDHASEVGYAVVLLTPDDEGKAKAASDLKPRARQNVVLELGYFFAKLGRGRVCALHKGGVELPSDIHGVIYVSLDSGPWKLELAKEMKAAGISVDLNDAFY